MNLYKKRISVWTLIFSLALTLTLMAMTIPAHGKTFMDRTGEAVSDIGSGVGEAMSDVGDAVSDIGSGIGEAVSDMTHGSDGDVKDSDGIIGNETGTDTSDDEGIPAWIGIVIALAIVAVVIILIVVLIPKKKNR